MKIRELFETTFDPESADMFVDTHKHNKLGNIIVNGVKASEWDLEYITFNCSDRMLTSLEGGPKKVDGSFKCSYNKLLTSLVGSPQHVGGSFECDSCDLLSLKGATQKINGKFSCNGNKNLTSLKGMPQEGVEAVFCVDCNLTSLEGLPNTSIPGTVSCVENKNLTSLRGLPNEVGNLYCNDTAISSFEGISKVIKGAASFTGCEGIKSAKNIHKHVNEIGDSILLPETVSSNILGFLKIKNLKFISFCHSNHKDEVKKEISGIINKYLPNPNIEQIMDCQNELIEAGFEDYAEL